MRMRSASGEEQACGAPPRPPVAASAPDAFVDPVTPPDAFTSLALLEQPNKIGASARANPNRALLRMINLCAARAYTAFLRSWPFRRLHLDVGKFHCQICTLRADTL